MGKGEEKVRRRIRRTKINNAIFTTVAVAGIISLAAIAPKAVEILGRSNYLRQRLFQTHKRVERLIAEGYLTRDQEGRVSLTEKGESFAALMQEGELVLKKPRRWDEKWRLLMFDIPERRKSTREKIRRILAGLGFVCLQGSVWVYPYDCEDVMTLLKIDARVGKEVLYVIADHIEHDKHLRVHFGLPLEV